MNPIGEHPPIGVARAVVDAIYNDRPYVFPDDEAREPIDRRLTAILASRGDKETPA
jgi:hypothetical protein